MQVPMMDVGPVVVRVDNTLMPVSVAMVIRIHIAGFMVVSVMFVGVCMSMVMLDQLMRVRVFMRLSEEQKCTCDHHRN